MNINRNNCEEFFLLYADNELSAAQRAQVEDFVKENPDLASELKMFCKTVLAPEPLITLKDKSGLYKESAFISNDNKEEIFILYQDNELNIDEQAATEKFLADNPLSQQLFAALAASRLQPELISFGNKASLYRKEHNSRVVPMFWRAAAAIILILLAVYGVISYKDKSGNNDVAIKLPASERQKLATPVIKQQTETSSKDNLAIKPVTKDLEVNSTDVQTRKKELVKSDDRNKTKNIPEQDKSQIVEQQPVQDEYAVNQLPAVTNQVGTERIKPPSTDYAVANNKQLQLPETELTNHAADALQASYKEEESKNDNYVFYNISEEKFKKSKVGIFLRKAKRVVTRNTFLSGSKGKIANVDVAPAK